MVKGDAPPFLAGPFFIVYNSISREGFLQNLMVDYSNAVRKNLEMGTL